MVLLSIRPPLSPKEFLLISRKFSEKNLKLSFLTRKKSVFLEAGFSGVFLITGSVGLLNYPQVSLFLSKEGFVVSAVFYSKFLLSVTSVKKLIDLSFVAPQPIGLFKSQVFLPITSVLFLKLFIFTLIKHVDCKSIN